MSCMPFDPLGFVKEFLGYPVYFVLAFIPEEQFSVSNCIFIYLCVCVCGVYSVYVWADAWADACHSTPTYRGQRTTLGRQISASPVCPEMVLWPEL